jgi:hypothetical protein
MALSATDKRKLRRAIPGRRINAKLIAVIDSGSATALAQVIERGVWTAFGRKIKSQAFITNIETGTAMSTASKRRLGRLIGRYAPGVANIATDVDALS